MENNDIRKAINEIEDDELDLIAGGTGSETEPDMTLEDYACPFCGTKVKFPRAYIKAWMTNHMACCTKKPC